MRRTLIGVVFLALSASCTSAVTRLTPLPTHTVHPDSEWESPEREAEMDFLIPAYNPLTSKDPTDQLLMRFRGKDRKTPKISIAPGQRETFTSIEALIATLPPDDAMRNRTPPLTRESDFRVPEENRNVRVTAWVYAIKYEADQDWHLIVGTDPQDPTPTYFNVEISGLPANNAPSYQRLKRVREDLAEMFDFDLPASGYWAYVPFRIVIDGSLFYDIDHPPGTVGPKATRPNTAWEIHPVTRLRER
jgi:hypothetical protein